MTNKVASDPIVLLHVVDQLDDLGVLRLVEVDVRWHCGILGQNQKLESDRPSLVLQFDRQLAP